MSLSPELREKMPNTTAVAERAWRQFAVKHPDQATEQEYEKFVGAFVKAVGTERARCAAILESPHAESREKLARHLALKSETPAEEAVQLLAKAPADPGPERGRNAFERAMDQLGNPTVGADLGDADDPDAQAEYELGQRIAAGHKRDKS